MTDFQEWRTLLRIMSKRNNRKAAARSGVGQRLELGAGLLRLFQKHRHVVNCEADATFTDRNWHRQWRDFLADFGDDPLQVDRRGGGCQ